MVINVIYLSLSYLRINFSNFTRKATVVYSDNFDTSTVSLRNNFNNMLGCIWLQNKYEKLIKTRAVDNFIKLIFDIKLNTKHTFYFLFSKHIRYISYQNDPKSNSCFVISHKIFLCVSLGGLVQELPSFQF